MHRLSRRWSRYRSLSVKRRTRLLVEELESRFLPAGLVPAPDFPIVLASGVNVTLNKAQDLQSLGFGSGVQVYGTIGNGPAGAADVAFYRFTLAQATQVHLGTSDQPLGNHLAATLTLYDTDSLDPLGHHLIAQNDGASSSAFATIDQTLGAGTYYVAVSGSGNDYFHPLIVGSGYAGATGDYDLLITAADAGIQPTDGPAVLAASAASIDGALLAGVPLPANSTGVTQLTASPYLLRVDLSAAIDPNTLQPDTNVILNYSPTSDFSSPTQLFGVQVNFNADPSGLNELQVTPPGPLGPGFYQLVILGNTSDAIANPGLQTVLDANDINPLGMNSSNATGQDYSFTFQVTGSEGVAGTVPSADDTAATARNLGSIAGAGRVQITGAIGIDPTDPAGFNPNAIELYHFRVDGTGNYAFAAEVFAGRIGSTLDPALSLFRLNTATGKLDFVASNLATNNTTTAAAGHQVLKNDAALFIGLTAGDYYLAVSSGKNAPNPAAGQPPGTFCFNPNISHSGLYGNSTGPYVLNLEVVPATFPPHVVSTSVTEGATLTAPPTALTVQFDRPVNVQQLAFAGSANGAPAFVLDGNGNTIVPRFLTYDPTTNQATYLFLDALPVGSYTLHLSGAHGLADFAGEPLVGNDPSGDYVVHFGVGGATRGTPGSPTAWVSKEANDTLATPQILGPLFPKELQATVTITGTSGPATDTTDYYQFTLLTTEDYHFRVAQFTGQPPVLALYLNGSAVKLTSQKDGSYLLPLPPGTYVLGVTWAAGGKAVETYVVNVWVPQLKENATPLTTGPAPALSLRLISDVAPPPPPVVSPVVPPPSPALVIAPPTSSIIPTPPTGTGATTLVSTPPGTQTLTVSVAGPVAAPLAAAVTVNGPTNNPGIGPQLALALSEGPLGGLRAAPNNGAGVESAPSSGNASAYLAVLATPLLVPQALNSGGDSTADEGATTVAADLAGPAGGVEIGALLLQGTANWAAALPAPDLLWILNQPLALTKALLQTGGATLDGFDRWLLDRPMPHVIGPTPSQGAQEFGPASPDSGNPDALGAVVAEFPALATTWTDQLSSRPFWWGATTFLCVVWGALNGHKWLVARRERRQQGLSLKQEESATAL